MLWSTGDNVPSAKTVNHVTRRIQSFVMFPVEKSHKLPNILGILAIVACFALTVSFNALSGAGELTYNI